ncbi:MAG: TrmB family transcriptional regulator [Acidilobus sp.]
MSFDRASLVEQLRRALDLTLYEAKLYLAILQGASDPKEASVMSGVPLPRIYDVVKVLESKGMVYRDQSGWYRAVSPRALAAISIAKLEEESRRKAREIMSLAEALEGLEAKAGRPRFAMVKGEFNIISVAVDFFKSSTSMYIVLSTRLRENGLGERLVKALLPYVSDLRVAVVDGQSTEALSALSGLGVKVKPLQHPLLDSLSSRTSLMVILGEPSGELVGLALEDPYQAEPYFRGLTRLWSS